jgi:F-type H+-transporting ATPase subunit a
MAAGLHISLAAEPIFNIGPLTITNSILATWVTGGLLALGGWLGTRRMKKVPEGWQNFVEMIVEFLENLAVSVVGEKKGRTFFPLVASFFIFIIAANWLGLFPGVGTIGLFELHEGERTFVPLLRAATADLNTTLALALVSVIAIQYWGLKFVGFKFYLKKFINFSGPIDFFVGILETISELAKIVSFSFRLFGNIFAGEVLLVVIAFLIPIIAPVPFLALELFVGFIQALVFAMLTLVFLSIATVKH